MTLRTWCARYGIVPYVRHGYQYLSGEQVSELIQLTTPTGGSMPRSKRPRSNDAQRKKRIEEGQRRAREAGLID